MEEKRELEKIPFVKYHICCSYLFSPAESRFIVHMLDMEYKKSRGFYTDWSRNEYMKIMGLNEYTFDKCVDRLLALNLLSRSYNRKGNRVYYSFNMETYGRLIRILSSTQDIGKIKEFCGRLIRDKKCNLDMVTEEEVASLKSNEDTKMAFFYGK